MVGPGNVPPYVHNRVGTPRRIQELIRSGLGIGFDPVFARRAIPSCPVAAVPVDWDSERA
jgi:hypothetical protein